jgi:hypothetical protein
MAHPDYEALLAAFARVDASIKTCDRGGIDGYTHIHSGTQIRGDRCASHWILVERSNGTVALRDPIGRKLGGQPRVALPISDHPLGWSVRADFGRYGWGFDAVTLLRRWATLEHFARDVIAAAREHGGW